MTTGVGRAVVTSPITARFDGSPVVVGRAAAFRVKPRQFIPNVCNDRFGRSRPCSRRGAAERRLCAATVPGRGNEFFSGGNGGMRHPIRLLAPVAVLATVLALVAGCGTNGVSALPKAQPPTTSPTPTDPSVAATGIDSSDLEVTDTVGSSPGVNLSFASPIYTV